mgnify:CR=1 FL=1
MDRPCRTSVCALAAVALAAALVAAAPSVWGASGIGMRELPIPASDAPLVNPGMGLYLMGTLSPEDLAPDAWYTPLVSIGYFRDDWAEVAGDREGDYRFADYFEPIFDLWVNKLGKRVAFRIMSSNMHSRRKHVTPEWVFDQGVPFVVHKGLYVPEQVDPVFWDERYLEIQERFIADLGRYLDGRPGLEFVDIGSIGEWGEMHLSRWTPEELERTGYSDARYIAAYRRIIDAFARAFPNTRVFLNVGDFEAINDYAALRGLHFRQDGLTPGGPSADVGKRFYHPYSRRGVICNYELHSGYQEMQQKGWGVRETFQKGLEDPISYQHINLMWYHELRQAPAEVREVVTEVARRIGFRFVLSRLRVSHPLRVSPTRPARLLVEHTWRNDGVAPCYDSYALVWSLVDARGRTVAEQLTFPRRPTTLWWQGEEVVLRDVLAVPPGTPPGGYRLRVAMVKPEQPELRLELGISGKQADGSYDLGEVVAQQDIGPAGVVYEEGFEGGAGGWQASEGMTLSAAAPGRGGGRALLMSGTQPGTSWNYAWHQLSQPILPGSRYRLSCWMRVDAVGANAVPPYLKIGVSDAQYQWLTNFNTNQYDLTRVGTWQRLVGMAETPTEAAYGHLAVEKGALEAHLEGVIAIDDVRLELLESP